MKLFHLQQKLSKLKCFTPVDIRRYTGLSETAVQKIISRYIQKGIFVRLRNGLYMFKNTPFPPLWYIANKVYNPSYISFETALAYYGFIPESVYTIISATSKTTRNFEIIDREFSYRKIKKEAFTGYKPIKIEDEIILFAEPEKALADYLYFVYLKKIRINERLKKTGIKKNILVKYIRTFKNKTFTEWNKNVIGKYY